MFSGKRLKLWQKRPSVAEQSATEKTASDGDKLTRSGRQKGKATPTPEVVKAKSNNDRSAASRTNLSLKGEEENNELQRLRNDYVKLEETVHSLMPYRNKTEILEKRLIGVSESYDRDRGLYEATIDVLRSENNRLRAELQRTRAACARCSFCSRVTSSSQTIESTGNFESLPRSVSSVEKVQHGEPISPGATTSFRPSPARHVDSSSSGGVGRGAASVRSKNASPATRSQPRQRAAGVNQIGETSDTRQKPLQRGARKPSEQQQRSPKAGSAAGKTGGKTGSDATGGSDTTSTTSSASGMDAGKGQKASGLGRTKPVSSNADGSGKPGSFGIGRAKSSPHFGRERQSVKPQLQQKPQQPKAGVIPEVTRKTTRVTAGETGEKFERSKPADDKQKLLVRVVPVHEVRKSPDGAGTPEAAKSFNDPHNTLDGCYNVQKTGTTIDVQGFRNGIDSAERNATGSDAIKDVEFIEETEIVPYDDVIVPAAAAMSADADAMETSTLSSVQSSSRASTVSINDILDGDAVADLLSAEFEASLLGLAAAAAAGGGEGRCSYAADVDGDGVEVEPNVDDDSLGRLLLLNDGFPRSAFTWNPPAISQLGRQCNRDKPILSGSDDPVSVKTTTSTGREVEQTAANLSPGANGREYRPWVLRVEPDEKPRSTPQTQHGAVIGHDAGPERQTAQQGKNEEATGSAASSISRESAAISIESREQFSDKTSVVTGADEVTNADLPQSNEVEEEQTCSNVSSCCFASAPIEVFVRSNNSLKNCTNTNSVEKRDAAEKIEILDDKTDRKELKIETLNDAAQSQRACSDSDKNDALNINHPQLSDRPHLRMENDQRTNKNFSLSFDKTAMKSSALPNSDINHGPGVASLPEEAAADEGVVNVVMTTSLGSPDDGYSSHSQGSTIASVHADEVDGHRSPESSTAPFHYDERRWPAPDTGPGKIVFHRRRSLSDAPDGPAVGKLSVDFPRQRSADDAAEVDISTDKVSALTAYFEDIHAEQCPGCQICLTGVVERPFVVVAQRRSSVSEDRVPARTAAVMKIPDGTGFLHLDKPLMSDELKECSVSGESATVGVESQGLEATRQVRPKYCRGQSVDELQTSLVVSARQRDDQKSRVDGDSSSFSPSSASDRKSVDKSADCCQNEEPRKSSCHGSNNSDSEFINKSCGVVDMATTSRSGDKASCRVTSVSLPDVSGNVAVLGSNPGLGRICKTLTSSVSAETGSCSGGRHSPFRVSYFRSHSLKSFGEMPDRERTRTGSVGNQLRRVVASAHSRQADAATDNHLPGGYQSNRKLILKTPTVSDVEIRNDATTSFNAPPIDVTGNTMMEPADEPEAPLTPDIIQEKYRIDRKLVLTSDGTRLPAETSTVGAVGVNQGCRADCADSDGNSSPWQLMVGKNNNSARKGKVDFAGECGGYDNFSCFIPATSPGSTNGSLSVKPPRVPRWTKIPDSGSTGASTPQSPVCTSSASTTSFPPTSTTSSQTSSPTTYSPPPGNNRLQDMTSPAGVQAQTSPLNRWNSDDPDCRQRRPFAGSTAAAWAATSEPPTDVWVPHVVNLPPLMSCGPAEATRPLPDQHQRRYSAEAAYTPPRRIVTTALQPIRNIDDATRAKEMFAAVGSAQQRKSTPPTGRKISSTGSIVPAVHGRVIGGGLNDVCQQKQSPATSESRISVPELPGHISVCIGLSVQCAPLKSAVIQTAMPPPISSPQTNRVVLNRVPELRPNPGQQHGSRALCPRLQHSWTDPAVPALHGRVETRCRPQQDRNIVPGFYYPQHLQHTRQYAAPGPGLSWYHNPGSVTPEYMSKDASYFRASHVDCKFPALVNDGVAVSQYNKIPRRKAGTVTDYSSDSMERRDLDGSPEDPLRSAIVGTDNSAEAGGFDGCKSVRNADESTTAFDEISQQIACLTRTVNELRSKYRGNEDLLAATRPVAAASTGIVMGSGGQGNTVGLRQQQQQQQQFRGGKRR